MCWLRILSLMTVLLDLVYASPFPVLAEQKRHEFDRLLLYFQWHRCQRRWLYWWLKQSALKRLSILCLLHQRLLRSTELLSDPGHGWRRRPAALLDCVEHFSQRQAFRQGLSCCIFPAASNR